MIDTYSFALSENKNTQKKRGLIMENNIIDKIIQIKDVLPKKQRMLCNYLAINYVDAGMMTVAELAQQSGVGTTTVMRLMKTLGYENYSDFKHDLFNISIMRNSSSYRGIKQSISAAIQSPSSSIGRYSSGWRQPTRSRISSPQRISSRSRRPWK